jgi:hypothetical protein
MLQSIAATDHAKLTAYFFHKLSDTMKTHNHPNESVPERCCVSENPSANLISKIAYHKTAKNDGKELVGMHSRQYNLLN